ncbi:hypothetical protein ABKV19_017630, partial [Rosa sericea]
GIRMDEGDGNAAGLDRIHVWKRRMVRAWVWTRACALGFGQRIKSRDRTRRWTSTPIP